MELFVIPTLHEVIMPAKLTDRKKFKKLHSFRATDEQWRQWKESAEKAGYSSVGEWIRLKLDAAARLGR